MRLIIPAVIACVVAVGLPVVSTAAYPERVITMIVAYVPGGGTDVVARALVPYIEKHLGPGAKIVVVNRSGAGGEIGFAAIANAPTDGYTIGFINTPGVVTIPIERPAQYTWQRFDLLGNVVDDPSCFAVHADSGFSNLAQLAAYAKANPGAVSVGTPGIGSTGHLAVLAFARLAGTQVNHIPFKGTGEVRTALAGRQIVVAAITVGECYQTLKGGTPLRTLAQLSAGRTTLAPELATAKEQGYNVEMASLRGLAAPRGLPADVRGRLVKAIEQAVVDSEFQVKSVQYYVPLRYLSPSEFEAELREADSQFRQLWKEVPWSEK